MYKNIERKQRLIEAQNDSSMESSAIDEDSSTTNNKKSSENKVSLANQKIFDSAFLKSVLKSNKK